MTFLDGPFGARVVDDHGAVRVAHRSGRNSNAFRTLKMAVFTPMPIASEKTATTTTPRCLARLRRL